MSKRPRTCVQNFSVNDIDYDSDDGEPEEKYKITENENHNELNAVEYETEEQHIKVEPDLDYEYLDEQQQYENGDENAEFVITEIDDPSAYSHLEDLKPFKKPEPEPSTSKYSCHICGKSFQYLRSYNQHRITHTLRSDVTTCEICHKELKRSALEYHMKYRHIDARNYQCEVCLNRFKSPGALRHHIATFHPREGFDCDECERVFKTRDFLRKHKDQVHAFKPVIIENFDCQYCNKSFQNQGQLTLHIGILGKKLGKCRDTL